MMKFSVPLLAAWANAAIFAVAGLVNFTAPRRVRELYEQWDVTPEFYRTLGVMEITAAVCLITPSLRAWGVALAAPIVFGSVVMLLDHRQYRYATAAVVMMIGLFVTVFAIPRASDLIIMQFSNETLMQEASVSLDD